MNGQFAHMPRQAPQTEPRVRTMATQRPRTRSTALSDRSVAVSVCVSTRDRAERLDRLLRALTKQTLPSTSFEVVVADDGSRDSTAEVLDRWSATAPFALTVLREETSRGPAAGRNRAWRAARGIRIAFTDDDCVPVPEWLEQGLQTLLPGTIAVGRIDRDPTNKEPAAAFVRDMRVTRAEVRWYATANLFIARADLERLGGFDERYRSAACEDTDLGLRAEAVGLRPVFAARALVHHDVVPASVLDKVRDQRRWADIALLIREHPEARQDLLYRGVFWRRTHAELLMLVAGLVLAPRRRWSLVLTIPWLHGKAATPQLDRTPTEVARLLPALLLIDAAETAAALEGSVRYRTLVL